jgi:hypothetical protein
VPGTASKSVEGKAVETYGHYVESAAVPEILVVEYVSPKNEEPGGVLGKPPYSPIPNTTSPAEPISLADKLAEKLKVRL